MQSSGQVQFNNQSQIHGNNWIHLKSEEKKRRKKSFAQSIEEDAKLDQERMEKLVESSNQFFFSIRTHLPFDLFPNQLIIDIHKVTMITKNLLSKDVISIPIKDLNKVEVYNDFWAASMELENGSQTTTISINWLKKDEARQAQALLQGLMIAYKNEINIESFPQSEILDKLETLGTPVV